MNPNAVKWGQLQRFFEARGFVILGRGGDKLVVAPSTHPLPVEGRNSVLIGHTSCSRAGNQVKPGYLRIICRNFGVTLEEIQSA